MSEEAEMPTPGSAPAVVTPQAPVQPQVQQQQPQTVTVPQETSLPVVQSEPEPEPEKPKTFNRVDVKRFVEVQLTFPKIYPDVVFRFKLKFKLSVKAEEDRQEWLALSPAELTEKTAESVMAQLCDLIIDEPEGFGDLKYNGKDWGSSFKSYVETSTDQEARDFLNLVAEGAYNLYWQAVSPREFRSKV